MTNNEMNKDNNQSSEEQNIPDVTMKNSKETKYRSGLLSFAFYLSIIYLVLFVLLFTLAGPWGIVLLIFLAPSLICILIATVLTGIGKNRGNKGLLYAGSGLYLISAFFAGDPDWFLFQIAPFVLAALVLFGTLMAKEVER